MLPIAALGKLTCIVHHRDGGSQPQNPATSRLMERFEGSNSGNTEPALKAQLFHECNVVSHTWQICRLDA